MPASTIYIAAPAGALSAGLPVNYVIMVDGKEILTTGTVEKIRRVGEMEIEVTLRHRKTRQLHTNVLDARQTVHVWAAFLQDGYTQEVQQGLPWEGVGEIWTESMTEQLRKKLDGNMWTFAGLPVEA